MTIFDYNNTYQKTPAIPRDDADGKQFLSVVAHAALTAKTPYKIILDEYGFVTAALTGDTGEYMIGVPQVAVASGAVGDLQIFGYCASTITASLSVSAGHALKIKSGAVADAGADYSGAKGEFAVNVTATTTSTTHNIFLLGKWIQGSDAKYEDNDQLIIGSGSDVVIDWDGTNLIIAAAADDSLIEIGDSATTQLSFDLKWYANEASGASYLYFDASGNLVYTTGVDIQIKDDDYLVFGTGAGASGDVQIEWDSGTGKLIMTATADDSVWEIGNGTNSFDVKIFGQTAGAYLLWDASANNLQTVGASVVVDGQVSHKTTVTSKTSAATVTYSAAEIVGGMISEANTEACAATTATAAQLVAAVPGAKVGSSFLFILKNAAGGAFTITVGGGSGVTITGTATVAQNNTKIFLVTFTNVTASSEAVTMYSIGTLVH